MNSVIDAIGAPPRSVAMCAVRSPRSRRTSSPESSAVMAVMRSDCSILAAQQPSLRRPPLRSELLVGLRYTRAKRRNRFIGVSSLISIIGICVGVAALIVVLSVMNGFQKEVRTRILGVVSHLQVTGAGNRL